MTLAAILEQAGFAPVAPAVSRQTEAPAALVPQRVPVVPSAPAQKQQGEAGMAGTPPILRARLLMLATAAQIDPHHVHRMLDPDLSDYAGLSDEQLTACLHMMADTADRQAGRVPAGDTAAMLCIHCGPVWIHPGIAEVLPVVDGLPRGLGCPWCFVRKAGGSVPRPALCSGGSRP